MIKSCLLKLLSLIHIWSGTTDKVITLAFSHRLSRLQVTYTPEAGEALSGVTIQRAKATANICLLYTSSDAVVLLPAVSVVPDRLNPLPAADNDGVALSVSVPPEPLTPFHVHVRVRVAAALMEDVPPLAAIVAGLADTVTFQALHDAYCLFPADWVIVQLADLPAWVAVYVILRVLVEVLLPALTVFPDKMCIRDSRTVYRI